jgi:hypothetical protein
VGDDGVPWCACGCRHYDDDDAPDDWCRLANDGRSLCLPAVRALAARCAAAEARITAALAQIPHAGERVPLVGRIARALRGGTP